MLRRLNFNLWYFLGNPPWDSGISPPELFDFLENHPAGRAIDIGCGTGTNVITLASHGWQVTGIDFALRAIQIARRKTQKAGVKANLSVGDATNLRGIDGPFDLALDLGCFHGVAHRDAYLDELARVLAPGGFWLMYGFFQPASNPSGPGLGEGDLESIQAHGFELISRRDGIDKRERPSAWFLHQKKR